MSERDDYEALFHSHLPFIDRVVEAVARHLGLRGADVEDFAWWAKERLWEGDYGILRKWRRESRLTTYLTTVVTNLGREFRVKRWGRWRPSAAAQRLGPLAIRLETLVYRDGLTLVEAAELLRTRGETDASDRELAELLGKIPERARPRRADEPVVVIESLPADERADDTVASAERIEERTFVYATMRAAIRALAPEEQVVVRMHFLEGHSLADVARALDVPQKPLYRLKDRALATLRQFLLAAGVTPDQLRDVIGGTLDLPNLADERDSAGPRPSNDPGDPPPPKTDGDGSSDETPPGTPEP